MSKFVWAHDKLTGKSGPVPQAVADLDPRYRPDTKRPVRDSLGQLLPWRDAAPTKTPEQPAQDPQTGKPEEGIK